jgi:hypothetical protein
MGPGGHPNFRELGTIQPQRLRGESLEELVRQDRRLQARPNRKPGMNDPGKTTRLAPERDASAIRSHALSALLAAFKNTEAA